MRTKTVTVHYCDHCNTRKFTIPAMAKHEKGCTANPNRVCGMCENLGRVSVPMAELIDLLKNFDIVLKAEGWWEDFCLDENCEKLMEATNGCPACALAALRQSGLGYSCNFDWKDQSRIYWETCGNQDHHH